MVEAEEGEEARAETAKNRAFGGRLERLIFAAAVPTEETIVSAAALSMQRGLMLSQRKGKRGIVFLLEEMLSSPVVVEMLSEELKHLELHFPSLSFRLSLVAAVFTLSFFCDTLTSKMAPHAAVGMDYEPSSPVAEVRRKKKEEREGARGECLCSLERKREIRNSRDLCSLHPFTLTQLSPSFCTLTLSSSGRRLQARSQAIVPRGE